MLVRKDLVHLRNQKDRSPQDIGGFHGKLLNSCTGKVENEPTHGSNVDIPHIHACKQTLGLSAEIQSDAFLVLIMTNVNNSIRSVTSNSTAVGDLRDFSMIQACVTGYRKGPGYIKMEDGDASSR
ncbi:hypothetical protein Tco_1571524 [Tanacetum coccineum]